jgi:hypothetical protein
MSSDESETEDDGYPVLRVKSMDWRRDQITEYMDLIDGHRHTTPGLFSKRGSAGMKRKRALPTNPSSRRAVKSLPSNLYDRRWSKEQGEGYLSWNMQAKEKIKWKDIAIR